MIRVVLADDHRIVCEALKQALEEEPDVQVVGVAGNGREAVRMTRDLRPDLVVLDVTMPELSGVEATKQIRENHPETKIIALSMHSDRRYVTGMLTAGASGYLVKDCALEELALALRTVMHGDSYLSPRIAGEVVESLRIAIAPVGAPAEQHAVLTSREREVLQLLAEGNRMRDIAAKLHVSVKTAETHRRQIMTKLGIESVAGLTKFAIREGLTTLEE